MSSTRSNSSGLPRRPRILEQLSDDDIRAADGVVLVDPDRGDWQQLLWSAPIGDDAMTSVTLQIVEIAVNSDEQNQIEAARERVASVKRTKPR